MRYDLLGEIMSLIILLAIMTTLLAILEIRKELIQLGKGHDSYICTYYGSEIIPPKGEEMQEEVEIEASNFRTLMANFTTISFSEDLEIRTGDVLIIEQDRNGVTKSYLIRKGDRDVYGSKE